MAVVGGTNVIDPEKFSTFQALAQEYKNGAGGPNLSAISKIMNIPRSTLYGWARKLATEDKVAAIEMPAFLEAEEDEPIEEIIERMARNYERRKRAADARKWFPIKVKDDKPIGILFVGDPHVDDPGCAWPILREHSRICGETEGMYAVNIGDSANWWGGRLIKKYADQETSIHTARRLVEWLLLESGFSWLVWLQGNHETMGDASPLINEMNRRFGTARVPMFEWEARFTLQFPNGAEFRVNAAHDFPGDSMWNPVHGAVKAARFGNDLDVLVCGHKHNWAIAQWEQAEQGNAPLMIRVRGYKHLDEYARRIGKYEQEQGQSILVIFDPRADSANRAQAFVDVEKGAKYLSFLRNN